MQKDPGSENTEFETFFLIKNKFDARLIITQAENVVLEIIVWVEEGKGPYNPCDSFIESTCRMG